MDSKEMRRLMAEQLTLARQLRARVRELEADRNTPLAVVGMALRLPGELSTPDAYWDFLLGDADGTREIPEDRPGLRSAYSPQPDTPGRSYVNRGGFLGDVAGFDPAFFGISQREADALDPQQRLLLETSWEAMERAGIAVRRQDRLNAGVFIGIMMDDYVDRLAQRGDRSAIDPYYGTGGGHSMAAGRVSYVMGLSGPALSVDTACSSSLVALHLGAQSLRRGECRYALVGGVNLIFSPDLMVSLCQNKALAPDGRTKAFLDSADGYGRGEGAGVAVLMRLADAEKEGRPILAVVRGSAINHDGASSGLTVPNGPAQQDVIRAALADAAIAPEAVGYVETHGTGTSLGDPIEAGALDAVLGTGASGRPEPLAIGSVKSRIGHLESAAGVAALIKVVLMLHDGRIPASATAADGPPNHLIPWDRLNLDLPRRTQPWPEAFPRRVAGISAFGMSGTNAHVVLEAYQPASADAPTEDPVPATAGGDRRTELLTVSAKSPDSLKELADAVASYLRDLPAEQLAAACATLRDGRTGFDHRIAVTGTDSVQLAERLATAAGAYRAPATRAPAPAVTLHLDPDRARLDKSLAALVTAHPALAAAAAGVLQEPADGLKRLLRDFGLRVTDGGTPPSTASTVAELVWDGRAHPLLTDDAQAAPRLLPEILAQLFGAGADLRLAGLRAPGTGRPADLPTYPFRRKRCWIEEPTAAPDPPAAAAVPEPEAAEPPATQAIVDFLHSELRKVVHAEESLDPHLSFLEHGGDSFTAMQLTMGIEERYDIEVPLEEFDFELTLADLFTRLSSYISRVRTADREQEPAR